MNYNDKTKEELTAIIDELQQDNAFLKKSLEEEVSGRRLAAKMLQSIIDNNPLSVQILDMGGHTIQVNRAFINIFGAIPPADYSIFSDPQLLDVGFAAYFAKLKKGEVVHFPFSYYNPHEFNPGSRDESLCLQAIGYTINNHNGVPEKIVITHFDITENKKTEESRHESKRMLEMVMDSIPQFIFWKDIHSVYLGCNENFAQVAGLESASEIVGKTDYDLAWEENEADFFIEVDKRVIESGRAEYHIIEPQLQADGKQAWLDTNKIPMHNSSGEIIGVLGTFEDITERKHADLLMQEKNEKIEAQNKEYLQINAALNQLIQELETAKQNAEESKKKLQLIANSFVNGMLYQVAMLDENKRQFNYVSDVVEKLYGCTAKAAKKDANLIYGKIHPEDINNLIQKEKEALNNMSIFKSEARVINPDGSTRWSYYISQPRIINGIVCWDGIEIDISDRKKMEFELTKAKERAEESDHLKTAFLQNMSHEIRTPLNAICGFSNLMDDPDLSAEERSYFISIVNNSSNQLLSIVNDILTISSLESKQVELNIETFILNEILDELFEIYNRQTRNKSVSIVIKKALADQQSTIFTDKTKLTQILTNIINNALKFTPEGIVEVGYVAKEGFLEFFVKDSGPGIQPDMHKKIFERFRQVDTSLNRTYGGSGLGLSISKGYVDILKGQIWLESEIGIGSTFYFTIPYKLAKKKGEKQNKLGGSNGSGHTILVAEDEEYNFLFIRELLERKSFKVLHTRDGLETIDMCKSNTDIELVLMDIKMPNLDGFAAAKKIKEFNPKLIIIAQTAYALKKDVERFKDVFDDYITKPIKSEIISDIVTKYFKG